MTLIEESVAEEGAAPIERASPVFRPEPIGMVDAAARRAVLSRLAELRGGAIMLRDARGAISVGNGDDLRAEVHVARGRFYRRALLGGSLAAAESYLDGDWHCDDLTALIRILLRDLATADRLEGRFARIAQLGNRIFHRLRANTRSGSRKNIHAHYDVGNEFFRLVLDDTLTYSSGIFLSPDDDLRAASIEKIDRICRKLDLRPGDEVVEIGTGWGGFALHAVANYGCRVTTTTISEQQFKLARSRAVEAGLDDRITFLNADYRDLPGLLGKNRFDKLVSVEMLEAVGHRFFDDYFGVCSQLLKPTGSMVVQTIVIPDQVYDRYIRSVDFIQRYVFPGGCLPSIGAMFASVGRATDLRFVHAEDFGSHYAETLRHWRDNFFGRLDDIRAQGYDDYFVRLWNYYLCYCEAAFEERYIGVVQMQFDKPKVRTDSIEIGARAAATAYTCESSSNRATSESDA